MSVLSYGITKKKKKKKNGFARSGARTAVRLFFLNGPFSWSGSLLTK